MQIEILIQLKQFNINKDLETLNEIFIQHKKKKNKTNSSR